MILYYSNISTHCTILRKQINDIQISHLFEMKSIDHMSTEDFINIGIQYVPTIITDNGQKYEKTNAFNYVIELMKSYNELCELCFIYSKCHKINNRYYCNHCLNPQKYPI